VAPRDRPSHGQAPPAAPSGLGPRPARPQEPRSRPPAPAADQPRHNLPAQLTPFVGRAPELAEAGQLLATARLLTLIGAGGIGKTRLALELASRLVDRYRDGVWWADLAPLAEPALVPRAVAAALGVAEETGRPLPESLARWLRGREVLLVLDNCEHLVGACAALADALLRACPGLRVLATSREVLGPTGELAWAVPSLALPPPPARAEVRRSAGDGTAGRRSGDSALSPQPSALLRYDAVRLFVERGRGATPLFSFTDRNAAAVAEVCRRLDGVPLALELAAVRLRALTVEQIAQRLDDHLRLLTGGSRTALPRHQTLRATIEWSHGLLSARERVLFRRLAVFAGGWTLEAAEVVCADPTPPVPTAVGGRSAGDGDRPLSEEDILDLLSALAARSLVVAEPSGDEERYRFLETIRQYADEKLREAAEAARVRARHAAYYLALATAAVAEEPVIDGADVGDRLEAEHDNLHAALRWLMTTDAASALRLGGALSAFWQLRGYLSEGRRWMAELLDLPGASERTAARASALHGAGWLALWQGDYAAAQALLERAVADWRALGDRRGLLYPVKALGMAHRRSDPDRARASYEELLALAWEVGEPDGVAGALHLLAELAMDQGDYAAAVPRFEESVAIRRGLGKKLHVAISLLQLARCLRAQGSLDRAQRLYEEALAASREAGWKSAVTDCLAGLGDIALVRGDADAASTRFRDSLALADELGDRPRIAAALERFAALAALRGQAARALHMLGAASGLREAVEASLAADERARVERSSDAARRRLAPDAAETAWAEGRAIGPDEAVGRALAVEERTPPARSVGKGYAGPLSAREREVAALIARGLTNRQIAERLVIAEGTVGVHVVHILNKLGFHSRVQVAAWAAEHGVAAEP
jgi:predicted ATPase/DNA-binding NarL/FixJ family response regulator